MVQHLKFHNGSFVLHKVKVNGHTYSAWFDRNGKPFSAEMILSSGVARNVLASQVNVWSQLEKVGKRYVA